MHPVIDPTEIDRTSLVQKCRMNSLGKLLRHENIFSKLITGDVFLPVLNEPALANKTYSRAKTRFQNQYVETIPAPERSLDMSAVERRGSTLAQEPAFIWAKKP